MIGVEKYLSDSTANNSNNERNFRALSLFQLGAHFSDDKILNKVKILQTYGQNSKIFEIIMHETVNFKKNNYSFQILSCDDDSPDGERWRPNVTKRYS